MNLLIFNGTDFEKELKGNLKLAAEAVGTAVKTGVLRFVAAPSKPLPHL